MNEQWIRELAVRFGLDVSKRVTTGTERHGFATFELSGPADRIGAAWVPFRDMGREGGMGPAFVYMRTSDADGRPYLAADSVWFSDGHAFGGRGELLESK